MPDMIALTLRFGKHAQADFLAAHINKGFTLWLDEN